MTKSKKETLNTMLNTPTGYSFPYACSVLHVESSSDGCRRCTFQSENGATYCPWRNACFADSRPDKKSVVFVEVKK